MGAGTLKQVQTLCQVRDSRKTREMTAWDAAKHGKTCRRRQLLHAAGLGNMSVTEAKKRLRREALVRRAARSPEEIAKASAEVVRRLEELPAFREAEAVFTYVSLPIEIDTRALIHRCLAKGQTVYVPACGDDGLLLWCRLHDWDELGPGKHGILEPRNPTPGELPPTKNTVCLVPGLLFDQTGHRLGYGGGYFDRFLAEYEGLSVGLVSAEFLHPRLPWEEHDIAVQVVLTELK